MFSLSDFMEDEDRALQEAVGPVAEAGSARAQGRRRGGAARAKLAARSPEPGDGPARRSEARRRPGA
jgi:hypothetical protein